MTTEQTNPAAPGVEQQPQPSVEDRLVAFYAKTPRRTAPTEAAQPAEEAEAAPDAADAAQPDAQPESSDLTPEDIPDDDTAETKAHPEVDEFEIVHGGQQHKLSREETIRLAQQGFDYTVKTQALAEKARAVEERLQRVTAIEQVSPQLQAAYAQAAALEQQVRQYDRVDWVALATNDPLEYSKVRAQYDVLNQTFQRAAGQYQQLRGAIGEQEKALRGQMVAAESQKLTERIPEWRDPEKFKAGAQELRTYLIESGAAPDEVDGLTSSLAVAIAYKAMKYDRLVKSKQAKVGQMRSAPPVTKPGAAQPPQSAGRQQYQEARANLKKTGDWRDAARLLAKAK